jgi:hypothetical protein
MENFMRRINRCLNHRLIELCQRTLQLEELNIKLSQALPEDLQPHCHVGSFNFGCLIIVVHDSVFATPLRYILPELRDKLRKEAGIYQLSSIKITIAMPEKTASTSQKTKFRLSDTSKAALIAAGDQCEYLPLKEALHHLARKNDSKL